MKVLVTGGAGFIGKAVVRALNEAGHKVKIFDRTIGSDVTKRIDCLFAGRDMDAVIHLAGILGTDELFDNVQSAIDINIKGTVNILDSCVENGAHYIGVTMLPVFPSIYTATKVSSQRFASAYHHNLGIRVSHVRAFNAYGPEQMHGAGHPRKIIPAFSREAWDGVPMIVWGDGTQTVDLIHVDDVASIFVAALDFPGRDELVDAGTGHGLTVNQVADFVLDITKSQAGVEHRPMRRGEIPSHVVSQGTGWELLNIEPPKFDELKLFKTIVSYK